MLLKPGFVDKFIKGVLVIVSGRLIVVLIIVVTECRQYRNIFKVFLEQARQGFVRLLQLGVPCIGFFICDVFVIVEINRNAVADQIAGNEDDIQVWIVIGQLCEGSFDHSFRQVTA